MQQKTKSKSKNDDKDRNSSILLILFILAVLFCLFGATLNAFMFCKSFFRSLTKVNETPIATITFKYKTAERKFADRVIWDRLRQNSPLYNGDTIHTESLSEATIHFIDGNTIDLAENSMAQVFITEDGIATASIGEGTATVDTSASEHGMSFSVNGMLVSLDRGGSVATGGNQIQVLSGNATVSSGGENVSVAEGEGVTLEEGGGKSQIVVTNPAPSSKILYFEEGEAQIPFKWKVSGQDVQGGLRLTVASDRNFTKEVFGSSKNALGQGTSGSVEVPLKNGAYYWNLSTASTGKVITWSRLQVIQSLPPKLLVPEDKFSYSYRTQSPAVRLIWSESAMASSYKLEIADNSSFTNPYIETSIEGTSAIISTLVRGNWWWRVTPYYAVNRIGYGKTSNTGFFTIDQKAGMEVPVLGVPAENSTVNSSGERGVNFSWKADPEAQSYTIMLSRDPNMESDVKQMETTKNFFVLPADEKLSQGKWYWTVVAKDKDGNSSPRAKPRSFYAQDGSLEQHTIEPTEGYMIAHNLLPDVTFSWKKNLPQTFTTEIQIARDKSFNSIVYSAEVNGSSTRVRDLSIGKYYWRIVSKSSSSTLETPPKGFSVVDSIPPTEMLTPLANGKAVVREGKPYNLKWRPVDGADYYRVEIFPEGSDVPVYKDVIYGTSANVNMYSTPGFVDKQNYRIEIQALSNAMPGVKTRMNGRLMKSSFLLAKLHPVNVTLPARGAKIDGLEAVYNPPYVTWTSEEPPAAAQVVIIRTDLKKPQIVMKFPTDEQVAKGIKVAPNKVRLVTENESLRSGSYEVIVYARTQDGIDISSTDKKYKGYFTILPVPPLPSPTNLTQTPSVFDMHYLSKASNERVIKLGWKKVSGANDYNLRIYNEEGSIIYEKYIGDNKEYVIDFVQLPPETKRALAKGSYTWTIQGLNRVDTDKDGKVDAVLQESPEISSNFVTDIPTPTKVTPRKSLNPYGK